MPASDGACVCRCSKGQMLLCMCAFTRTHVSVCVFICTRVRTGLRPHANPPKYEIKILQNMKCGLSAPRSHEFPSSTAAGAPAPAAAPRGGPPRILQNMPRECSVLEDSHEMCACGCDRAPTCMCLTVPARPFCTCICMDIHTCMNAHACMSFACAVERHDHVPHTTCMCVCAGQVCATCSCLLEITRRRLACMRHHSTSCPPASSSTMASPKVCGGGCEGPDGSLHTGANSRLCTRTRAT